MLGIASSKFQQKLEEGWYIQARKPALNTKIGHVILAQITDGFSDNVVKS